MLRLCSPVICGQPNGFHAGFTGFFQKSPPKRTWPMLTRKQYELLMFIHERIRESGVPPSFDEMKDALDLKSKSGIHRLITALEERGFLRRMEKRARALEVTRLPENMAETARPATTRSQSQRILPSARHGRDA